MSQLRFHPQFKRDVSTTARYYEQVLVGLGDDFRAEVAQAISRIIDHPYSGALVDEHIRHQVLRQFPYHILYRVEGEAIFIMSVTHQRRRPGRWRRRR